MQIKVTLLWMVEVVVFSFTKMFALLDSSSPSSVGLKFESNKTRRNPGLLKAEKSKIVY